MWPCQVYPIHAGLSNGLVIVPVLRFQWFSRNHPEDSHYQLSLRLSLHLVLQASCRLYRVVTPCTLCCTWDLVAGLEAEHGGWLGGLPLSMVSFSFECAVKRTSTSSPTPHENVKARLVQVILSLWPLRQGFPSYFRCTVLPSGVMDYGILRILFMISVFISEVSEIR